MILFKKLRWKNFLSTGNVYTEIDLTRSPSTVITGENGAGKSTILDALCYSLFNRPFRNINKPQLLNTINEKGMTTEVEFSIGNVEYLVRRGMKPSVFEILKNGKLIDQPGSVRDYQTQLEDTILKLNYKSFTQIVVLGNASFTPFMQLSAKDRREVIEDLLDIQIFSKMNVLLRDRLSTNKSSLSDIEYRADLNEEKVALQLKYLKRVEEDVQSQIDDKKREIEEYRQEYQDKDQQREVHDTRVEELTRKLAKESTLSSKMDKMVELRNKLMDKTRKAEKRLAFFEKNDHCPTCEQGIEHTVKEDKLCKTQDIISKTESALVELNSQYEKVTEQMDALVAIRTEMNNESKLSTELVMGMQHCAKMIKTIEANISKLESNDASVSDVQTELKRLRTELSHLEKKKEELLNEREVLEIASKMLKDGGIKSKIIRQYIPIMNKLVNKYLSAMDFFVKFELDEEFNEVIKSRYRDEFSYASFSEGEKMRIDLALLFTWRSIAKLKNSTNTNLLILDEVFDASLDSTGCDEFLKLLNELGKETNVFVISHKGDILTDKFRSQIRFEKVKNFSRIAA